MKTKKFSSKLRLSKETVANLNNTDMKDVYGGIPSPKTRIIIESGCDCGTGSAPGNCC